MFPGDILGGFSLPYCPDVFIFSLIILYKSTNIPLGLGSGE
ncbi:hypothetical protein NSP_38400 [Nodularia spumigena CCY9414]|nr:hypothetical protein NSP_38400 [Nodularia spumigena CCY9414]